jgi:hypothetical protein
MTLDIDTPTPFRDMRANATTIPRTKRGAAWGWLFVYLTCAVATVLMVGGYFIVQGVLALLDAVQCMNCGGL